MERTDEALYKSFIKHNDEDAMRLLFGRYNKKLIYFINEIVHNIDDAQELMMDCFTAVIAATTRFSGRGGCSFRTWLYAIATKRAYMFLRKNNKTDSFDPDKIISSDDAVFPEDGLLDRERYRSLYKALEKLPGDQRTVLYLKYFEDMGTDEIAGVMNKNIKQIYNLTQRGREGLKTALGNLPEGGGFEGDIR